MFTIDIEKPLKAAAYQNLSFNDSHLQPQTSPERDAQEYLHQFHSELGRFNAKRLEPAFMHDDWRNDLEAAHQMQIKEGYFIEQERSKIVDLARQAPQQPDAFVAWFEELRNTGPGQGDPLFPWLAQEATLEEMRWFLTQEAAGEAGFDDLVAMSQLKLPARPKLEMARNYWDEMGRGHDSGMHGPMLSAVVHDLKLTPTIENTIWQSLALANLMMGLAANRRYSYQAIGALGVIEMTAPGRVAQVNEGLKRLGIPFKTRKYFQLHASLDIEHSKAWNAEVFYPLVEKNPRVAQPLAEGALMRLACGARCFRQYRQHFGLGNRR